MNKTVCKKCSSDNCIKNGNVRNQQRYKYKKCGCNFIEDDRREKFTSVTKALSILLYGRGKASYGFIAKLFIDNSVAVMKMLKREVDKMPETEINSSIKEVSFNEMWHFVNQKKLWVWLAVECSSNRTVGWCAGDRSTETFRRFYEKFEHLDAIFYSDNWESYSEVLPAEKHKIGKQYTICIEQNNSNTRYFLGRFTRRIKAVSKSVKMAPATLKICWYINECNGFELYQNMLIMIFG